MEEREAAAEAAVQAKAQANPHPHPHPQSHPHPNPRPNPNLHPNPNPNQVSCELASAEWLADEKEKAAHREEALKLQLHHAHGHALAQQGELRKAQKEATQMAHHASQMMQQAEEWEQLARRHAAELAAVEEVRGATRREHDEAMREARAT